MSEPPGFVIRLLNGACRHVIALLERVSVPLLLLIVVVAVFAPRLLKTLEDLGGPSPFHPIRLLSSGEGSASQTAGLTKLAEAALLMLILGFSLCEELIELNRKRWRPAHLALTPPRLLYDVLTSPKYLFRPIARPLGRAVAAGAVFPHIAGRVLAVVLVPLFLVNLIWLLGLAHRGLSAPASLASDARFVEAMVAGVLIYVGRVAIGGRANDFDPLQRFDSDYAKPVNTPYYKEIIVAIVAVVFLVFCLI